MKNRKGFTLIELLAVIIILGILLIIAIPAVTTYVQDSRKEAYIKSAKSMIRIAMSDVNSGKYPVYDTDATFYLPGRCLKTENEFDSPYGEWKDNYVVFTYDGNGFDYYWTSLDTSGAGIYLTYLELLDTDRIYFNLKEIPLNITVGARSRIIKFDNCNPNDITELDVGEIIEEQSYYDPENIIDSDSQKAMFTQGWRFLNTLSSHGIDKTEVVAFKKSSKLDQTKNPFRVDCVGITSNDATCKEYPTEIYAWYDASQKTLYWYSKDLKPSINYMSELHDNQDVEHNYFNGFTALTDISGVRNFDITASDGIVSMFDGCSSLTNLSPLSYWDMSTVKYTKKSFRNTGVTSVESIKSWNTSNFTQIDEMFRGSKVTSFKPLGSWDISKITSASNIFTSTPTNTKKDLVPYDEWLSQKSGWSWNWNYSTFSGS